MSKEESIVHEVTK